jgi:arylsulfatase
MRKVFLLIGMFAYCLNGYGQQVREKPNVIVILTDDQGYADFSCNGNPVLKTPALDKLYNESVRFSNFHVSPLCTPTRGELMSGLDALHNKAATVGTGRDMMRRDIITMPEAFRQNGYQTGIFGKWHLGDNYPDRPMDRGFQKCIWFKGWGLLSEAEYDNSYYSTRYLDSLTTTYSGEFCTDLWFDQAIKWMGKMADQGEPFFTYLATNAPHGPFDARREDYQFYKNKVKKKKVAKFFGLIRNIDWNMARLEKWLQERNIAKNTLIIFMNDNGSAGGSEFYNDGMRGKKGSNYDGGHRAVCFIRWPDGNIGKPRTITYAAEVQDILPTFVDLLGFKMKETHHFDGESLKPVLRQQHGKEKGRMFVVQYGGDVRPEKYFSCVVWNSWRLVGHDELYNISKDPGEKDNVAKDHPGVLENMRSFYEKWWKKAGPGVDKFIPLVIGAEQEDPVTLTSDFWSDSAYVNTQWKVALAGGPPQGGIWHIHADKGGKYKLELSRWPFHLNRNLTVMGPDTAVGGVKLRQGKALPVEFGCISLDHGEPVIVRKSNRRATDITIEMNIPAGDNTLQAWFKDKSRQDICGAYYVRIKRMF